MIFLSSVTFPGLDHHFYPTSRQTCPLLLMLDWIFILQNEIQTPENLSTPPFPLYVFGCFYFISFFMVRIDLLGSDNGG